jgi:DNA-directed RNA polymerase specialized sigma24 family protein
MEQGRKPWWADDPEIAAIRRRVEEELERACREPIRPDEPDPVVQDFYSGASLRELAAARDDLERARARYADAVHAARTVGLSWGEIGRVLGVSKQVLHRRFSRPLRSTQTGEDA